MRRLAWVLVFAPLCASAQGDGDLRRREALLLLKVLSYDYTLAARCRSALRVGVVYRVDLPSSVTAGHALHNALGRLAEERFTVQRLAVQLTLVPFRGQEDAAARARRAGLCALLLAPGVPEAHLPPLLALARAERWNTLSVQAAHTRAGVAVAVVQQGHAFRVLVNRRAAELQGSRFAAQLFKVAQAVAP